MNTVSSPVAKPCDATQAAIGAVIGTRPLPSVATVERVGGLPQPAEHRHAEDAGDHQRRADQAADAGGCCWNPTRPKWSSATEVITAAVTVSPVNRPAPSCPAPTSIDTM